MLLRLARPLPVREAFFNPPPLCSHFTTLSFDGIGSASAKRSGYSALAAPRGLFNGLCLFYRLDQGLMSPTSVLKLDPRPDYVLYQ